jgi:transcriptional antiterminator Rof (Rho-off)
MNITYLPIACALHDEYEIAIMQKKYLNIKWLDEEGDYHTEKVLPKDLVVKNREEFLLALLQGNKELCIRLDKITLLEN